MARNEYKRMQSCILREYHSYCQSELARNVYGPPPSALVAARHCWKPPCTLRILEPCHYKNIFALRRLCKNICFGYTKKIREIIAEKEFPIHLMWTVQSIQRNITITISKVRANGNTHIEVNKRIRQRCPLSPIHFNIYTDKSHQRLAESDQRF
jgi:hypothetical protein